MAMSEYGAQPVYNVGSTDGLGGGSMWIWFLFILLFLGGNGGGLFGGNTAANTVNTDFQFANLGGKIDAVNGQVYGLSKDIYQGFSQTAMQIANQTNSMDRGFCEVIQAGNLNTRDIIASQTASTQAILDKLTCQEMQSLRDQLLASQMALSNAAQTQTIVSTVRPYPVPTFPVPAPFPIPTA